MNKPFIIDAHLDLSMNALEWNRDLREPLKEINRREIGMRPISPTVETPLYRLRNCVKETSG